MTALDLSRAPSLRPLWRPGMALSPEVRRAMATGYRPGPVQHRRAASAPPFTLASLNARLWLPADAAYTYQDATGSPPGTTLVSATGQSIGTRRDRGSLGAHFTQSSSGLRPTVAALSPLLDQYNGSTQLLAGPQTISVAGTQVLAFRFRFFAALGSGSFCCPIGLRGASTWGLIWIDNGAVFSRQLNFILGAAYTSGTQDVLGCALPLDTSEHTVVIERTAPGTGANPSAPAEYVATVDGTAQTVSVSGSGIAGRTSGDPSTLGADYYSGSVGRYGNVGFKNVVYLDRAFASSSEKTNTIGAL